MCGARHKFISGLNYPEAPPSMLSGQIHFTDPKYITIGDVSRTALHVTRAAGTEYRMLHRSGILGRHMKTVFFSTRSMSLVVCLVYSAGARRKNSGHMCAQRVSGFGKKNSPQNIIYLYMSAWQHFPSHGLSSERVCQPNTPSKSTRSNRI